MQGESGKQTQRTWMKNTGNLSKYFTHEFTCNTGNIFTVRNEVAKVMFLQACVCPHGGGECLPQCMLGCPPRAVTPPGADTTPQEQTPPWEQTPPEQTAPGADTQSRHSPGADTPPLPRETATAADGTHPTGMHFC